MANHCSVKTKKLMSAKKISDLLADLNMRCFKGNLHIEYYKGENGSWGPDVWDLEYLSIGQSFGTRVCWLNSNRSFEIRHGGGGDFIWWVDNVITNEVAVVFNGIISDDGVEEKWPGVPNKYDSFKKYLYNMWKHIKEPKLKPFLDEMMSMVPPEFRF